MDSGGMVVPAVDSSGTSNTVAISLTLMLGVIGMTFYGFTLRKKGASEEQIKLDEEKRQARIVAKRPSDGVYTIKTLEQWDGLDLPLCLGVCGQVVDCSSSENIKAGQGGYGALWAGRDATYALATLSLKAEDANKMDFKVDELDQDQKKALAGWYKHFTTKYPVVGTIEEYKDWDFSVILEAAKAETPFGAKATTDKAPMSDGDDTAGAKETAKENATPIGEQNLPEGSVVLRPNDRVLITGHEDRPEVIGLEGTLKNLVSGKFVVELDDGMGTENFKPSQLAKKAKVNLDF